MTENKKKRRTPQEMEMGRIEAELAAVKSICAALLPIDPDKREWALKAAMDYLRPDLLPRKEVDDDETADGDV